MATGHTCYDYCGGRLQGIAANLRLRGELPEDFIIDVVPLKPGLRWIPGKTWTAKCEHGRSFILRPTKKTRLKYPEGEKS